MSRPSSPREEAAALLQGLMGVVNGRGAGRSLQLQHQEGLTFPQVIALYHLDGSPEPQSVSNLAEAAHLSLAATSQLIDRMVEAGLVTRGQGEGDRRVRIVAITAKGRGLLRRLHGIRSEEWEQTLGRLPRQLQQRLVAVMREVIAALK